MKKYEACDIIKDNPNLVKDKATKKKAGGESLYTTTIDKKPFIITLSTLLALIIFVITSTWAIASIKISLDATIADHNKRLSRIEKDYEQIRTKQTKQELDLMEMKIDLKYIIQLQEEMKRSINERR